MVQVIGAGLPRTGTTSLKHMLEHLLGDRCYHMSDLYQRSEVDGLKWLAALNGEIDVLDDLLDGWAAAVDWPASLFWPELAEQHPDALVVLSHRGSSETWWASADRTVWHVMREIKQGRAPEHVDGIHRLMRQRAGFAEDLAELGARTRYDEHFAEVVAAIPQDRLLRWQPSDGWEPLCERLGVPVPDEEPPHRNTTSDFRSRFEPGEGDQT